MWGSISWRRKRREGTSASSIQPVLADYHRDLLSDRGRRRLTLAFFTGNLVLGFLFAALPDESKPLLTIPLFAMLALIVWLLPETGRPPTRFMTTTFFFYFIALTMWPYYLAIQLPGAPLIEIRRFFLLLTVIGLLLCLSVSREFRTVMKEIMAARPIFFKFLVAFVAVQALSLVGTPEPASASLTFIRNQLQWTAIAFISMHVLSKPGRVIFFANLICALAIILAIMAYFELENQQVLWANHIPSFLQINDPVMERLLSPVFRSGEYRVKGPFSVSLTFAEFLCLTLPFFLQYILFGRNMFLRVIYMVADALVINAILDTQARVGIVGMIVAHAIYGLVWSVRFWHTRKDNVFGPAFVLAYPVGLFFFSLAMIFVGRLRGLWLGGAEEGASTDGRLAQAALFPSTFLHRPLFGYGPMQGAEALGYRNQAGEMSIDSALLSIPLDYGAFGFICYYGMFIYMLIEAMKLAFSAKDREASYAMPASVALAIWLTARIVLSQEDNTSFAYMILGMIAALAYQRKKLGAEGDRNRQDASPRPEKPRRRSLLRGLGRPGLSS